MSEYIYTTYGTEAVLKMIQAKQAPRPLFLAVDVADSKHFQLIEKTNNIDSPFQSGTRYEILKTQKPEFELRGLMHWEYVTLNDDERDPFILRWQQWVQQQDGVLNEALLQVPHSFEYALLSTWRQNRDLILAQPERKRFLAPFAGDNSYHHLRQKDFAFAQLRQTH